MGPQRTTLIRLWFILGIFCISACLVTQTILVVFGLLEQFYATDGGRRRRVERNFPCEERSQTSYFGQRGKYWVLYNYIVGSKSFDCDESITFTTPGDMTYLDKLVPLIERWQGPVSVALYSPGSDFEATLDRINYIRECSSPLIKTLATFHLFFDSDQMPNSTIIHHFRKEIPQEPLPNNVDCGTRLDFGDGMNSFRKESGLFYPINVARNIAKEMATTHYILAADIELFPSPGLIPKFIEMIRRNDSDLSRTSPSVFVLPHFEVEANLTKLPEDKSELQELLKQGMAVPFHKFVCSQCHRIPKQAEWEWKQMKSEITIFHIVKRIGARRLWEPFYIGTKSEPMWDERLSWEGGSNKMTQNYIMCLLDYDYLVVDNAFLVHSPGIKKSPKVVTSFTKEQYQFSKNTIIPEINTLYGTRDGCTF